MARWNRYNKTRYILNSLKDPRETLYARGDLNRYDPGIKEEWNRRIIKKNWRSKIVGTAKNQKWIGFKIN